MTSLPTAAAVICTLNRPQDIVRCVASLATQSVCPDQIIVVDAGDLRSVSETLEKSCSDAGIQYRYLRDNPSTTRQRNTGADAANADVVFFFDDDVELAGNYIEEVLSCYDADPAGRIGGITGVIDPPSPATSGFWKAFARLFFLAETKQNCGSSMKPSSFPCHSTDLNEQAECEIMPSTAVSYRLDVFQEYRFDSELSGYVMAEDLDLSYRVSRDHTLLSISDAIFRHTKSPVARNSTREHEKRRVLFTQYFFQKNMGRYFRNRLIRCWSLFGLALKYVIVGFRRGRFDRLQGFLDGIRLAKRNGLFGTERPGIGPLDLGSKT